MNKASKSISIIERGLTIDGDVSGDGQLIVKGTLKGSLSAEHVIVAEGGRIHASAKVETLSIGGEVEGDIQVSQGLTVLSAGSLAGRITCRHFVVEAGGALDARICCADPQQKIERLTYAGQ